jgi:uncharacterized membrane protein
MSNQILVYLFAIIPTFEARYSIIAGITKFNIPIAEAFLLASLGTFTATVLMIIALYYVLPHLKLKFIEDITKKIFEYTQKKHSKTIANMAAIGVITFIAVPLPGTGIYSGSIVCYLMGYSPRKTLALCTTGMLISTTIALIATVGITALINLT